MSDQKSSAGEPMSDVTQKIEFDPPCNCAINKSRLKQGVIGPHHAPSCPQYGGVRPENEPQKMATVVSVETSATPVHMPPSGLIGGIHKRMEETTLLPSSEIGSETETGQPEPVGRCNRQSIDEATPLSGEGGERKPRCGRCGGRGKVIDYPDESLGPKLSKIADCPDCSAKEKP